MAEVSGAGSADIAAGMRGDEPTPYRFIFDHGPRLPVGCDRQRRATGRDPDKLRGAVRAPQRAASFAGSGSARTLSDHIPYRFLL